MKVTNVKTTALSIPNKEPYYYSQGHNLGVNTVLVEIETDEGITGIGEACGDRSVEATHGRNWECSSNIASRDRDSKAVLTHADRRARARRTHAI